MSGHDEQERKLLEEGAESYVPAVSAILAFRDLVQSRIRQVVERRLTEYIVALGVALSKGKLLPFETGSSEWNGQWAGLGIQLKDVGDVKAWLYHTLDWFLGEDGQWNTGVSVSIWLYKRDQVDLLWEKCFPQPINLGREEGGKEIWVFEEIAHSEIGDFDKKLDSVLSQWIELWKRIGGLKVLSIESAS